jgi:hypothetical protein
VVENLGEVRLEPGQNVATDAKRRNGATPINPSAVRPSTPPFQAAKLPRKPMNELRVFSISTEQAIHARAGLQADE